MKPPLSLLLRAEYYLLQQERELLYQDMDELRFLKLFSANAKDLFLIICARHSLKNLIGPKIECLF